MDAHEFDPDLLEYSEEDLFAVIGHSVSPSKNLIPDIPALVKAGRAWFDAQKDDLRTRICIEDVRRLGDSANDDVALIVAMADLIAAITGHVSPFTVSVIILRVGLRNFCDVRR